MLAWQRYLTTLNQARRIYSPDRLAPMLEKEYNHILIGLATFGSFKISVAAPRELTPEIKTLVQQLQSRVIKLNSMFPPKQNKE